MNDRRVLRIIDGLLTPEECERFIRVLDNEDLTLVERGDLATYERNIWIGRLERVAVDAADAEPVVGGLERLEGHHEPAELGGMMEFEVDDAATQMLVRKRQRGRRVHTVKLAAGIV
jgi:hypothetical protein